MNVSIIVPVYQVAPYIEACLKSVMQQTYRGSMECLLIDDCGTDDSIAIAERLTATYDGPVRFRVLHHERNKGLSASRNTGQAQAEGEFIFFLDSDDEISHECIELLTSYLYERLETIDGCIGCICIQVFMNPATGDVVGIEINPRFGGGYPQTYAAGGNYAEYLIREYFLGEEIQYKDDWKDHLLMLRYDDAVYV